MQAIKKTDLVLMPVENIKRNEHLSNNAFIFGDKGLQAIINSYGNILPVIVTKEKESEIYVIISGQEQFNEMVNLNFKEIPVCIIELYDLAEISCATLRLMLNIKLERNSIFESRLIHMLISLGIPRKEIALKVNKSKSWISKRESLYNKLNLQVQDLVIKRYIGCKVAEKISKLPNEIQLQFASKTIDDKLSVEYVSRCVEKYNNPNTSDILKERILQNPLSLKLLQLKRRSYKGRKNKTERDLAETISSAICLLSEINKKLNNSKDLNSVGLIDLLRNLFNESESTTMILRNILKNKNNIDINSDDFIK